MKRTRKFVAAEKIALEIGVNIDENIYQNLEQNNYFWHSEDGDWFKFGLPEPPTNLVKIRVWAAREKIAQDCEQIIHALDSHDFVLEERSERYLCRPPKQSEARIYLTFSRKQ